MGDANFPFLFHGVAPDDWFDEPVHAWMLRFDRAPDAAARAAVAHAWEQAARRELRGHGADLSAPWLWSDAWALVRVRPGDRSRDAMRALFAAVGVVLVDVHRASPLAEVVYAQACDMSSGSAWEAWTVALAPSPSEAPPWPADVVTHAKRTRKRSKAAVDEDFERARADARQGLDAPVRAKRDDDADEGDGDDGDGDGDDGSDGDDGDGDDGDGDGGDGDGGDGSDDADATPAGEAAVALPTLRGYPLRLVPVDSDALAAQQDAQLARFSKAEDTYDMPDGAVAVTTRAGRKAAKATLSVWAGGEVFATTVDPERRYFARAWDPSRRELLLVSADLRTLEAVPVDGGPARVLWVDLATDTLQAAFVLAGGELVVVHGRGAALYTQGVDGPVASHHLWPDDTALGAPDRRAVVTRSSDAATVVSVVAPAAGALRVAGEAAVATQGWCEFFRVDDALYVRDVDRAWRVDGIAEAVDALEAAPGDTERFPALVAFQSPEARVDPARNEDPDDCVSRGDDAREADDDATAERWYRRAVALRPTHPRSWLGLARTLLRGGRADEAAASLARALTEYDTAIAVADAASADEDADDPEQLRFERAVVLGLQRRRDDALAALRPLVPAGAAGNYVRREVLHEEAFAWLKGDADFDALTAKPVKAKRSAKKRARDAGE